MKGIVNNVNYDFSKDFYFKTKTGEYISFADYLGKNSNATDARVLPINTIDPSDFFGIGLSWVEENLLLNKKLSHSYSHYFYVLGLDKINLYVFNKKSIRALIQKFNNLEQDEEDKKVDSLFDEINQKKGEFFCFLYRDEICFICTLACLRKLENIRMDTVRGYYKVLASFNNPELIHTYLTTSHPIFQKQLIVNYYDVPEVKKIDLSSMVMDKSHRRK